MSSLLNFTESLFERVKWTAINLWKERRILSIKESRNDVWPATVAGLTRVLCVWSRGSHSVWLLLFSLGNSVGGVWIIFLRETDSEQKICYKPLLNSSIFHYLSGKQKNTSAYSQTKYEWEYLFWNLKSKVIRKAYLIDYLHLKCVFNGLLANCKHVRKTCEKMKR